MKYNILKTSFASGELGRKMVAREEADQYKSGVATMLNYVPSKSSGAFRRDPTRNLLEWTVSPATNKPGNLVQIPFMGSDGTALVLVFTLPTNTYSDLVSLSDQSTYKWTVSPAQAGEYYCEAIAGGDPGIQPPGFVFEDSVRMVAGMPGDLAVGEYFHGDNDTLGYDTTYVRITGSGDVDSEAVDYIQTSSFPKLSAAFASIYNAGTGAAVGDVIGGFYWNPLITDSTDFHIFQSGPRVVIIHKEGKIPPYVLLTRGLTDTYADEFSFWPMEDAVIPENAAGSAYMEPAYHYMPPFKLINPQTDVKIAISAIGASPGVLEAEGGTYAYLTAYSDSGKTTAIELFGSPHADYWVNRYVKCLQSTTEGIVKIVSVVSPTKVRCKIIIGFDNTTTAYDSWSISEWGGIGAYAVYPRSCCSYQGRYVFGGSSEEPSRLWNSDSRRGREGFFLQQKLIQDASTDASGLDYYSDAGATDPFDRDVATDDPTAIRFLSNVDGIFIGTNTTELVVRGLDGLYSSTTAVSDAKSFYGASNIMPVKVAEGLIYFTPDKRGLRYVQYKATSGKYSNTDISILADDIVDHPYSTTFETFSMGVYDRIRNIAWLMVSSTNAQGVIGVSIDETSKAIGLHRHVLGLGDNESITVNSLCAVGSNFLIAATRGYLNTLTYYKQNVERMINQNLTADLAYSGATYSRGLYLDRMTTQTAASTKSWTDTKFAYAEDLCVIDLVTQAYELVDVNASGVFTLTTAATGIMYGFKYDSTIIDLPLETGSRSGQSRGYTTKISRLTAILYDTYYVKIGTRDKDDTDYLDPHTFASNQTGDYKVDLKHPPDRLGQVKITTDQPYKANVLGFAVKGEVQEED